MRTISAAALLTFALALVPVAAQAPPERKLQVSFDGQGNVSVVAENVSIPEILGEWARRGGTVMVNAERLPRVPVSKYYVNEPEQSVIASLLRQAAGYIVAPRRVGTVGASRFELVQILPTSTSTASTTYVPPPTSAVQAPVATTPGSPDDEIPPVLPPGANRPPAPVNNNTPPPPSPNSTYQSGVPVAVVPVIPVAPVGPTGGAPAQPAPQPGQTTTPPGGRGRGGGSR